MVQDQIHRDKFSDTDPSNVEAETEGGKGRFRIAFHENDQANDLFTAPMIRPTLSAFYPIYFFEKWPMIE